LARNPPFEFVRAEGDALVKSAYLLTGDPALGQRP
jgi:hypothetical protein